MFLARLLCICINDAVRLLLRGRGAEAGGGAYSKGPGASAHRRTIRPRSGGPCDWSTWPGLTTATGAV